MRAHLWTLVPATVALLLLASPAAPTVNPSESSKEAADRAASEALADSLAPSPGGVAKENQSLPTNPSQPAEGLPDPAAPPDAPTQPQDLKPKLPPKPVANLFRIPGPAAIIQARAAGYHFSPAGAAGARNGIHTVAEQYPNTVTSEVDGVILRQFRPPPGWAKPAISNTFYMFVEANLQPAPLAPGWKIRGIQLKGNNWAWADGPMSGAPSTSFAITITAPKFGPLSNDVILEGLVLEGPPGETDWRTAFAPNKNLLKR